VAGSIIGRAHRSIARKEATMPLSTILEAPEHESDDDKGDDEEFGTDGDEFELDEFDDIDEDDDEEI
jgi:hypothetical protein